MALATDYVSIDEARFDLRVEPNQADDATLARYISDAVGTVASLTGRNLLDAESADIKPGLRTCVAMVLWARFESPSVTPPALRNLCEPFRLIVPVPTDGTPAGGELSFRVVDIQVAGPHERNDPRGIALRTNIPIPADGVSAVRGVFGANDGFLTQWFSIENSELRRRSPHFGGSLPSQSDAAMEVSVTSVSQLWIGRTPDNGFVFQHLTDNFYPYRILVGRWRAIPVR